MPSLTRTEFCEKYVIDKGTVGKDIERGRLKLYRSKFIKEEDPTNAIYIANRLGKKRGLVEKLEAAAPENTETRRFNPDFTPSDLESMGVSELIQTEKKEKILKTREEREILALKKSKTKGENLPIKMVAPIITAIVDAVCVELEQEYEASVIHSQAVLGLTRDETSKMRASMSRSVNEAKTKAAAAAKSAIRKISLEAAGKRGRGEKK